MKTRLLTLAAVAPRSRRARPCGLRRQRRLEQHHRGADQHDAGIDPERRRRRPSPSRPTRAAQLAYTETEVTAPAGNDTIEFDNPASLGHDVVIEDDDGNEVAKTDLIASSTTTTTADLKPGTYTFFCSVPGHRDAGMEGTLTVK